MVPVIAVQRSAQVNLGRCGRCHRLNVLYFPFFETTPIPLTLEEMDVASVSNYLWLKDVDSSKLQRKGIRLHEEEL